MAWVVVVREVGWAAGGWEEGWVVVATAVG